MVVTYVIPHVSATLPITRFPSLRMPPRLPSKLLSTGSTISASKITNSWDSDSPLIVPLNQSIAAIIFGDGSESRLYPLTKRRSDGAVPVAANYRLIDIVLSNCINSNITKIYALTQFNSTSLNSHLYKGYSRLGFDKDGFVEVLAAYQSPEDHDWFQGNADAVRNCLWVLEEQPVMDFLILPGHHLYRMDYQKLIQFHRKNNVDITLATSSTTRNLDPGFGFLVTKDGNQVSDFRKKPERELQESMIGESSKKLNKYDGIGNMGVYVIKRDVMINLLSKYYPEANDFASEIIPGAISMGMKVEPYIFDGYWEDMGNIEAFYQANMEITKKKAAGFDFYDRDNPIYSLPRHLPPSWTSNAEITESIIGEGCIFKSCKIQGSVIGMRTWIGDGAVVEDSVVMGADIYETGHVQRCMMGKDGIDIPIGIGELSYIRKAIIDKNARIGKNVKIMNVDNVQEGSKEGQGYCIHGGIIIVLRGSVIPDGSIL